MAIKEFLLNLRILLSFWRIIRNQDFILGETVRSLEKELKKICGGKYVFGVTSGTDALILALKACGIGPGDEVIVPAIGFFSTAAAVSWVNAKPVFVDIDSRTATIDVAGIKQAVTSATRAIIPIHLDGQTADIDPIMEIADNHDLFVITDAAHAVGSKYKNRPIGQLGDIACISFNPKKIWGAYGDGGAVITSNQSLAKSVSRMRMYGANSLDDIYSQNKIVGIASRLSSFHAAVLKETLPSLNLRIIRQRKNWYLYYDLLKEVGDILLSEDRHDCLINGYRFSIRTSQRDELFHFLYQRKIRAKIFYPTPLPYVPAFKELGYRKGQFPVAEGFSRNVLSLPTHYSLTNREIKHISSLIKYFFKDSVLI